MSGARKRTRARWHWLGRSSVATFAGWALHEIDNGEFARVGVLRWKPRYVVTAVRGRERVELPPHAKSLDARLAAEAWAHERAGGAR